MCSNDELRDEVLEKIEEVENRFDSAMRKVGKRLDDQAKCMGKFSSNAFNADVNSKAALKGVGEIKALLEDAHVGDAAKVFQGGEVIAKGVVWWSKVLAAGALLYGSWTNIDWVYWWHLIFNGRPH